MLVVDGRTLGVFAALGAAFSLVLLDPLSGRTELTERRPISASTTAIALPVPAQRGGVVASTDDHRTDPCGRGRAAAHPVETAATARASVLASVAAVEGDDTNRHDPACREVGRRPPPS
jgi:hypothetical protein